MTWLSTDVPVLVTSNCCSCVEPHSEHVVAGVDVFLQFQRKTARLQFTIHVPREFREEGKSPRVFNTTKSSVQRRCELLCYHICHEKQVTLGYWYGLKINPYIVHLQFVLQQLYLFLFIHLNIAEHTSGSSFICTRRDVIQ